MDVYFPNISNIKTRRTAVLSELGASGTEREKKTNDEMFENLINLFFFSGALTFFWFIGFCYMTDQWRQEDQKDLPEWNGRNSVQAAIAFAFFSILVWV